MNPNLIRECCNCKRINLGDGWKDHKLPSRAEITSSYCPSCQEKVLDEVGKAKERRGRIAFDLDGVLYNTKDTNFRIEQEIRAKLGYPPISEEEYFKVFQTKDWNKFYKDLGIRAEDVQGVIDMFIQTFDQAEPIELVPDAEHAIKIAENVVGHERVYIITNAPLNGVRKRFERDRLTHYLDRLVTPYEGKAVELYNLAMMKETPFAYLGDLVSDGEACLEAREKGAKNIRFYGLTHKYAFSPKEKMERFAAEHGDFAQTLNSLEDIKEVWNLPSLRL